MTDMSGSQVEVMGALPRSADMIRLQRDHDELHGDPLSGATCAPNCPGEPNCTKPRVPNPCGVDGCAGHLAKFPDCLTEALWEVSMIDGESTGSTEAYGHYTLIHYPEAETHVMGHALGVTDPDAVHVDIPAGWYMVGTNDQGSVWHTSYADEAEARADFAIAEEEYSAWLDVNEPEYESDIPPNAGSSE
jgi:hypothetical protein